MRVKTNLVLESIKAQESFEVTEDELNAEFEKYAEMQKTDVDAIKKIFAQDNYEYIKDTIAMRKTIDFLVEHATMK